MRRGELTELHYITPVENVPSILERGILSNQKAARHKHLSVAMEVIQDRRRLVTIPGARKLHEYVNLYINARNKMMYCLQDRHDGLCVLRVSPEVLDVPGVVIADKNASSDYVRFAPAPEGLQRIDRERVFAESWRHPDDEREQLRHGSEMCAEVLVPDCVESGYIVGAYVPGQESLGKLQKTTEGLPACVNRHLFFR